METYKLLHPQRLDISAKYAYARLRECAGDLPWATKVYHDHIMSMCGGREESPRKENVQDFFNAFHDTLNSIKSYGFDDQKKAIPVAEENHSLILNGAHRVAACLLYGVVAPTRVLKTKNPWRPHYSYKWFASVGLQKQILDFMLLEYVRLRPDSRLAIVWPPAVSKIEVIESIFHQHCTVVATKKVKFLEKAPVNIIRQVYAGEEWLGTAYNKFNGAHDKAKMCFPGLDFLYCLLLQSDSADTISVAKEKVRENIGVTYAAIHTTDTHAETLRVAKCFFNENSIHFLNHAIPAESSQLLKRLAKYQEAIGERDEFAIHGSSVMDVYGIRASEDLDYISTHTDKIINDQHISLDNEKVEYISAKLSEMLFDPRNYFYYNGIKFVNLSVVKKTKQARNEAKDTDDIELISECISASRNKFNVIDSLRVESTPIKREWIETAVLLRRRKREKKLQFAVVLLALALLISLL